MNYAVILSGGTGSRLKGIDIPKQYYQVGARTMISYVIETIELAACMDAYVIVAAKEWQGVIQEEMKRLSQANPVLGSKFYGFAEPGENRQLSILHGLQGLRQQAGERDIVLIQDAARPLTSEALIQRCVEAAKNADGAMPVLRMKDTVYYSTDGKKIDSLLERDKILAGQAPEAFAYGVYLRANESLTREELLKINGSTEPAIKAGMNILLVDGEEDNFKITTGEDLRRFERIMEDGRR